MSALVGRRALVTGAAGGIGGATAERLAREGAWVTLTDVRAEPAEQTVARIVADGGHAKFLPHDVTDEQAWQSVVRHIVGKFGGLDILVNNAAVGYREAIDGTSRAEYERVVEVSQTSVFLGMKHAGPALKASGRGSVINISSICGSSGTTGRSLAYHAAKGAVRVMTKNVAMRWATDSVRVNSVHPGYIRSPPVISAGSTFVESVLSTVPMRRLGEPSEVAAAVAFLAGDDASFITGSEIDVDGGFLTR